MASIKLRSTKAGDYYEIRVKPVGKPEYSKRWYIPDGWSKRRIDKELATVAAGFERRCNTGEVETRKERAARIAREEAEAKAVQEAEERRKAEEEARKLTVRQYCERVLMPYIIIEKRRTRNTVS